MATKKTQTVQTTNADAAFKRVKPLLDRLRDDIRSAAAVVAKEYDALPKLEKANFADQVRAEYGWSRSRLDEFAVIGRRAPNKLQVIQSRAPGHCVDTSNMALLGEICKTDDTLLQSAAKSGMFDKPVSSRDVHRLRTKGMLPTDIKPITKPVTDLQKIKALMANAEAYIRKASVDVSKITALMFDADITEAKGREATALIKSFEKLCLEIAAANPKTSKRAFAILRGDV